MPNIRAREPQAIPTDRIEYLAERQDELGSALVAAMAALLHRYSERSQLVVGYISGAEVELHPGVVVYVPRGVKHKAVGELTVLTVCIPRGVLHDIHELE